MNLVLKFPFGETLRFFILLLLLTWSAIAQELPQASDFLGLGKARQQYPKFRELPISSFHKLPFVGFLLRLEFANALPFGLEQRHFVKENGIKQVTLGLWSADEDGYPIHPERKPELIASFDFDRSGRVTKQKRGARGRTLNEYHFEYRENAWTIRSKDQTSTLRVNDDGRKSLIVGTGGSSHHEWRLDPLNRFAWRGTKGQGSEWTSFDPETGLLSTLTEETNRNGRNQIIKGYQFKWDGSLPLIGQGYTNNFNGSGNTKNLYRDFILKDISTKGKPGIKHERHSRHTDGKIYHTHYLDIKRQSESPHLLEYLFNGKTVNFKYNRLRTLVSIHESSISPKGPKKTVVFRAEEMGDGSERHSLNFSDMFVNGDSLFRGDFQIRFRANGELSRIIYTEGGARGVWKPIDMNYYD